jgi:hypothetical protein
VTVAVTNVRDRDRVRGRPSALYFAQELSRIRLVHARALQVSGCKGKGKSNAGAVHLLLADLRFDEPLLRCTEQRPDIATKREQAR